MSSAIEEAITRKPNMIITTGGLGPTFDDITLEAVAKAINKKLVLNEKALEYIKLRLEILKEKRGIDLELTEDRMRMAYLPDGAIALRNRAGSAPGVLVEVDDIMLFSVPGVPREMESIFDYEIINYFQIGDNALHERSIIVNYIPESELAAAITKVRENYPNIYFKTHPRTTSTAQAGIIEVEIHITSFCSEEEDELLSQVEKELVKIIEGMKGSKGEEPKIRLQNDIIEEKSEE